MDTNKRMTLQTRQLLEWNKKNRRKRSIMKTTIFKGIIATFSLCSTLYAAGIGDLSAVKSWEKIGNGVWKTAVGDVSNEVLYSDFAGDPPKIEQLNRLQNLPMRKALRNLKYRVNEDGKIMIHIPTEPGEKVFGFGLQFDGTQKTGKIVELKVDHFNKGGGATHAPVPFYISSKGYGVFFNTSKYIKIYNMIGNRKDALNNPPEIDRNPPADEPQAGRWQAVPKSSAVEAYVHAKGMEVVGFSGIDFQDVVARYNLYSGGGAMPPMWGLGFWHRTPAKFNAKQTEREVAEFKQYDIPLDVIGLEPGWQSKSYPCTYEWQKKRFPNSAKFTQQLLNDGIHLNLWINPYISKHAGIYKKMYPLSGSHMVWLGIVPDYMLATARNILMEQFKKDHFDIGVSGYKIDEVDGYDFWLWPDHATFPSGTSAETMRQIYGLQLQQMMHKELYRKNNQRTYSLVRASNGTASNYPFAIYSDSYGHNQYITGLSSASLCGILWCPEIRSAGHEREWINRMHTVCFSPMAMLNAWASGTKPWSFKNATDAIRRTIKLRMKLLPYLYTAFADYNQKGIPPVRSMLLETGASQQKVINQKRRLDSEKDPYGDGFHQTVKEDNSLFMFGPNIMMAPFYNRDTKRKVNLPKGNWYDFYTGKFVGNNQQITVTAKALNDMPPLFVKEGSFVPMLKNSVNQTKDIVGKTLEVRFYGKESGAYTLYEDDMTTFNFAKGEWMKRQFTAEKQSDGIIRFSEKLIGNQACKIYGEVTFRQMTK